MNIRKNIKTSFMPEVREPQISETASIDKEAVIIGAVILEENTLVEGTVVLRGDEGFDIHIGKNTVIQTEVIIHGLETFDDGHKVEGNIVKVNGNEYSVYVGENCVVEAGAQIHGPCIVENKVLMRPDSFAFKATIGHGAIIGPGAKVIGVNIPPRYYVPANTVINNQSQVEKLQKVEDVEKFERLPRTSFTENIDVNMPVKIKKGMDSYVDSKAILLGKIDIGNQVYVAPFAYIIGDKDEIEIGDNSNIQDGAVISCGSSFRGVIIEEKVSFAHQSKIFGGQVGTGTFVGMQSELYDVIVENHCVIEPGCIIEGVRIPEGTYIVSGSNICSQKVADKLPVITEDYVFKNLNHAVVHVNEQLSKGYSKGL